MPVISVFYGIKVMMFWFDTDYHHKPHIHIQYGGDEASVDIKTGNLLAGTFPSKQLKLVQAWIEIHRNELIDNWRLALSGEPVQKIKPLK
ncbi:MAG: DUF4160 domain-containing protein [Balneolaceae bacterium]